MTTRTMTVTPDQFSIDGQAWSAELPSLIVQEYHDGEIVKRVRIQMRPIDIEELASKLWELCAKYEQALKDMTSALKGPTP